MSENRGKPRLVIAWQHGSLGGAQIYLIGLARELSQTFETLFLIPSDSPATTIAYLRESGLTYLQTDLGKELTDVSGVFGKIGRHLGKLRSDIRFVRAVLTNSVESDVLHVELTPWQSMLALLLISKFRETFCTVHNRVMEVSETRKTLWRIKFWCLGNLSRIRIFATNKDAKDFLDELSTSELKRRILVVPTSADMARATEARTFIGAEAISLGLADRIGPQSLRETRQRMRHRADSRGRRPVELAHEGEDPGERVDVDGNFRLGQLQTREPRDVFDVGTGEAHEATLRLSVGVGCRGENPP